MWFSTHGEFFRIAFIGYDRNQNLRKTNTLCNLKILKSKKKKNNKKQRV